MSKIYNISQGTQTWHKLRAGKITSLNGHKIMKKNGLGVGGKSYCNEITSGLIQDYFDNGITTKGMRDGVEREPIAVEVYEREEITISHKVGFIVYYTDNLDLKHLNGFIGVSPDRLIGDEGGLEVKCPEYKQHTYNLINNNFEEKYKDQIQMCLFVTGRKWWDIISFNPDFKEGFRHKIKRNYPCKDWQTTFIKRATECKKIVDNNLKIIKYKQNTESKGDLLQ